MAGGLARMQIPANHDEPGKRRAGWSGHDGTHVTVIEVLAEARAALDQGDAKTALSSVDDAIRSYNREGRGLGMPLEAAAMKSLADCQFQLQAMLADVKFAGGPTPYHFAMASRYLNDAELKAGAYSGYAEASTPSAPPATVNTATATASNSGGDHSHDEVVDAAIASIDKAIQQELAENEATDDSASLRVAKAALQHFLQIEHAEYEGDDDDAS